MKKAGKDIHNPGPNIVMGAEAQVALEKFARYFEVECRLVPVTPEVSYIYDLACGICGSWADGGNRVTSLWMLRML